MQQDFRSQLSYYLQQAGLPISRVARQAGIPRQTVFNWLNGTHPRWHMHLQDDLLRLSVALGLNDAQIAQMLALAGCTPSAAADSHSAEETMEQLRLPHGWFAGGNQRHNYVIGIDPLVQYDDKTCVTLKAKHEPISGFGTLMQNFAANNYRRQRLRLSGMIKVDEALHGAGLWMRIDGLQQQALAFDNMQDRLITGTRDWTYAAVVLNVPVEAESIALGVMLVDSGQMWLADVHIETVGADVPTTDRPALPAQPVNLTFDA